MISGTRLVPIWLLLLALNACGTVPTYNPVGCVYDATTDQRAMVFNFRTHWMSFQDKRYVDMNSSSEFGGYFHDCSDSSYFCLSGPLSIVIPITIHGNEWKYKGVACKAKILSVANNYAISCEDSYGRKTYFDYSARHGVSAIRQLDGGDEVNFVLRGGCGIFCEQRITEKRQQ